MDPQEDDTLIDELLQSNVKFQALVEKSKVSPRKPLSPNDCAQPNGSKSSEPSISEMWQKGNERAWLNALDRYWQFVRPSLLDLEIELNSLDSVAVQEMNREQWYEFLLNKYFRWKYTAPNRYATTTRQLKTYCGKGELDELYAIKKNLFTFDRADIREGLKIAKRIRGLGTAGASGLLSVLFPSFFGTVDQFAVKALREIKTLDNMNQIEKMNATNLLIKDAVILIDIMRK